MRLTGEGSSPSITDRRGLPFSSDVKGSERGGDHDDHPPTHRSFQPLLLRNSVCDLRSVRSRHTATSTTARTRIGTQPTTGSSSSPYVASQTDHRVCCGLPSALLERGTFTISLPILADASPTRRLISTKSVSEFQTTSRPSPNPLISHYFPKEIVEEGCFISVVSCQSTP